MDLVNHTDLPAVLAAGITDKDGGLFGSLVVRATFEIREKVAHIADEQVWEVSLGPWEGPQGKMNGDELFYRGGVDVFVFGSARVPKGKAAGRSIVSIRIGQEFHHSLVVFGRRIWKRSGEDLVPSEPEVFTEIPLLLSEAFGGKDVWDELPIPYPANPDGKGYYISKESAEGSPLPHIESLEQPIRQWSDQPDPVGMGVPPYPFGPRMRDTVEFDPETSELTKLDPHFFNHSFPGMTAPNTISPGMEIILEGVTDGEPFSFKIPDIGLEARVTLGETVIDVKMSIDQIGLEPDLNRIFVSYRYPFRYVMRPEQKRLCELFRKDAKGGLEVVP